MYLFFYTFSYSDVRVFKYTTFWLGIECRYVKENSNGDMENVVHDSKILID